MISQKEFMIGCLIGSAIGAAAVAISTNYGDKLGNKLNGLSLHHKKKSIPRHTAHSIVAAKGPKTKKGPPKRPAKHKPH